MARSDIETLLPLDRYAQLMAIPGWSFNQCTHPGRPGRGVCTEPLHQSGYTGDPNRILGRDDIALAIARAEEVASGIMGFWPSPKWVCDEEHRWGNLWYPSFTLNKGLFISGGVETWDWLGEFAVAYTDEDLDGYTERASLTVGASYLYEDAVLDADPCELVVVPAGYNASKFAIRPLDKTVNDDSSITMRGWRWQFAKPEGWLGIDAIPFEDDAYFVEGVDVWRRYNSPAHQGRIVWRGKSLDSDCAPCGFVSQNGCIQVVSERTSITHLIPGTYTGSSWQRAAFAYGYLPTHARFWYLSGYTESGCDDCFKMSQRLEQAIVSLANAYMIEAPCACKPSMERYTRDVEELDVTDYTTAAAKQLLGTTAQGAVTAYTVLNSLALGKGG